jgi:hypothetical protein
MNVRRTMVVAACVQFVPTPTEATSAHAARVLRVTDLLAVLVNKYPSQVDQSRVERSQPLLVWEPQSTLYT